MSIAWTPEKPEAPNRGAAAVGMLSELAAQDRAAIVAFRNWCDGPLGREAVARDFARAFSGGRAAHELNAFADLVGMMLSAPRRSIMRHGVTCACFGGDEAAFAHMVAAATAGDQEDAMAFALILMQPNAAWQAVKVARGVGLCFLQMTRVRRPLSDSRLH
jgi:hypothetical protein